MKKIVNKVLAVALLATMFGIGGITLFSNYRSLAYAGLRTYTQYLKPDGNVFDNISARIRSVESIINVNIFSKRFFQLFNARFQMALGKEMLSFGGTMMVRLKNGALYDVQKDADVSLDVESMVKINENLEKKGIPLVYVYMHSILYEDGLLPDGVLDFNNKVADDIVKSLRAGGVNTIDSRDIYNTYQFSHGDAMTLDQAVLRTDQHCAPMMSFAVYAEAVKALNETGKIALDENATKIENFTIDVFGGAHMGDVGARVGESGVVPDDIPIITPTYETNIKRFSRLTSKDNEEVEGTFRDAVLNMDILDQNLPANIYNVYGYQNERTFFTNEALPSGRLLIIKDSFGTPSASMMSLASREVCALDLRKSSDMTIEKMVDEYKPDAVLILHCQEILRGNKNYVFVD